MLLEQKKEDESEEEDEEEVYRRIYAVPRKLESYCTILYSIALCHLKLFEPWAPDPHTFSFSVSGATVRARTR